MIFRKAFLSDADAVTEIYDGAKKILRDSGIPQWQGTVPGRGSFISDVENGSAYVVCDEDKIIATIQIIEYEPYYEHVDGGAWRDSNSIVAHHVAVSNECRKKGVAAFMLENAERIAVEMGKTSLRLDTHELNHRMKNLLEKCGFINIGTVKMPNGDPRLAYEKIL